MTEAIHNRADLCALFVGEGVELGVARGDFSETILARGQCHRLWSIDRWNDHHNLQEATHAARRLVTKGQGRCIPLRMTFAEALPSFPDASLDFVYIDGYAHTGQEGGKTLEDWWPKLRAGGIFAGHDYHPRWHPTMQVVDAFVLARTLALSTTAAAAGDPFPSWWVRKPFPNYLVVPEERVVLVGNGPSALRGDCGAQIDAFDTVVRFNAFAIEGFEAKVGTRTDLWSTYGKVKAPQDESQRPQRVIYLHGEPPPEAFAFPVQQIYGIPGKFYASLRAELQGRTTRTGAARDKLLPTSGLVVALWLLREHGLSQITLHGFDHFAKTQSHQHHYWVPKAYGKPAEHDGDLEAALFAELAAQGRVRYLTQAHA